MSFYDYFYDLVMNIDWSKAKKESDVNKILMKELKERKILYDRNECKSLGQGHPDFDIWWIGNIHQVEVKFEDNQLRPDQRLWFAAHPDNQYLLIVKGGIPKVYQRYEVIKKIKEGEL